MVLKRMTRLEWEIVVDLVVFLAMLVFKGASPTAILEDSATRSSKRCNYGGIINKNIMQTSLLTYVGNWSHIK